MKNNYFGALLGLFIILALVGCSERDDPFVPVVEDEPELVNPVIDLLSNPLGAQVTILQPNLAKADNPLGEVVFSGTTPVFGLELEPGSYVARFSAEAYDDKLLGLRLAYGDTNISRTVDLELTPADPPEYEDASGYLTFSANPITLNETVRVTATINYGVLGILSMGGETYFSQTEGAYVFPFTPTTAGEHLVSLLIVGEGGDFLPVNEYLTVLPAEPEEVDLRAWMSGYDNIVDGVYQIYLDSEAEINWAASVTADSVTVMSENYNGLVGQSGSMTFEGQNLGSYYYNFSAWQGGEVVKQKAVVIDVKYRPEQLPELSFGCSASEIEGNTFQVKIFEGQTSVPVYLIGSVRFYNEETDQVQLLGVHDDMGPAWVVPVYVEADTSFTAVVDRSGDRVQEKTIFIQVVNDPGPPPEYIDLRVDTPGAWVGQRPEDPKERDLLSFDYFPANSRIEVWAYFEYSPESYNQDDESGAIGIIDAFGQEDWAVLEGADCPVLPDQGHSDANGVYYLGYTGGHQEGTVKLRAGSEFACHQPGKSLKCDNANSLHCKELILRIHLIQ